MNGEKKIAIIVLILLVGSIVLLSVIYAVLSTNLNISSEDAVVEPWNIIYDTTYSSTSTISGNPGNISFTENDTKVVISGISLNRCNDSIYYYFKVKNSWTIRAKLKKISCAMSSNGGEVTYTDLKDNVKVEVYYTSDLSYLGLAINLNIDINDRNPIINGGSFIYMIVKINYIEAVFPDVTQIFKVDFLSHWVDGRQ